jgi:hypothetical protein
MRVLRAEFGAKFDCHSAAKSGFGHQIRLPIGSSRYIQPVEVKVFCDVRQAIFERQNKFFRCRQGGSIASRLRPERTRFRILDSSHNFTSVLAAQFLTVHSQQCYGSDL